MATRWVAAVLGLLAIALVDWVTGTELRVFPLYYVPISLVAWTARRRAALAFAALASVAWLVSNASVADRDVVIYTFNGVMQTASFVLVGVLLAELKRRLDREMETSRVDTLTGLANRRGFFERADLLVAAARRKPRPFALAVLDLDRFKEVNDTWGHEAGDAALRAVADVLRRALRASDLPARLGGDELAILMPDTDAEAARAISARVRAALSDAMSGGGWPVTASIGIVCVDGPPPSLGELLERADALMYEAKKGGRDRASIGAWEGTLENEEGSGDSPA